MYAVLFLPEGAEPEIFGPYSTATAGANALRQIASAAAQVLEVEHSDVLATVEVTISGESHRYQLLKLASPMQLGIHADVIREERESGKVVGSVRHPTPPAGRLSGY